MLATKITVRHLSTIVHSWEFSFPELRLFWPEERNECGGYRQAQEHVQLPLTWECTNLQNQRRGKSRIDETSSSSVVQTMFRDTKLIQLRPHKENLLANT